MRRLRPGVPLPPRRRGRGQSLLIFALSFTVLLGFAGLSVDALRAFDLYGRMQRAAEAGALAGVLYMPTYYNTARPGDADSAVSRASKEVAKNGFGSVLATTASACPSDPRSVEVAICQVSTAPNQIQVVITEHLNLVLVGALGLGPTTITAVGQAEYLPPVQLGSRLNYFGDQMECSSVNPPDPTQTHACTITASSSTDNHLQYFIATMKGPATLKEQGDPMVYCEEGPANIGATDGSAYSYTTYNNQSTNHQQWTDALTNHCGLPSSTQAGNPDQQPTGYDGPATHSTVHPGGYNYEVIVPQGISTASLWIFNPSYVPGGSGLDTMDAGATHVTATGGGITTSSSNRDSPAMYFNTTYTLYSVTGQYDRGSDTLVKSLNYPAYDITSADLSAHGCTSGTTPAYDPYWSDYKGTGSTINTFYNPSSLALANGNGCLDLNTNTAPSWHSTAPAPCYMQWCPFSVNLGPGIYRFVGETTGYVTNTTAYHSGTTDGAGAHSYALKICPTSSGLSNPLGCGTGASGSNPGVSVFGWNNMEIAFNANVGNLTPSATNPATSCVTSSATAYTCLDLGCIPTAYAGRTLNISLFDPGDGGGDIYIGVIAPPASGATVSYASWVTTSTIDGDTVVHARFNSSPAYNSLNGLWLKAQISLPSSYTGNCQTGAGGTGWWQMVYVDGNGSPNDTLNVSMTLVGSPVHLVSPTLG